jgi:glyceraldehyde-3-phosphate dehydrogenase (NADP+)
MAKSSQKQKVWKLFLSGLWTSTKDTLDVIYPHTGKAIAKVSLASPQQIEAALHAAVIAFQETRKQPSYARSELCRKVSEGLRARADEFARWMCLETGKPLKDCLGEVDRAVSTWAIAAEEANRIGGEVLPLDIAPRAKGRQGFVRRYPIGPITAITPFNFPLNLVSHKVAPALASGNPVILKPASKTPLSSLLLAEVVEAAGAIPGSFQVLPASSRIVGPLIEDDRVKMVTFTGGIQVGWDIKRRAYKKRVTLELGGNAPAIVHADADIDFAVQKIVAGAFYYAGQNCVRAQRLIVHEKAYDAFRAKLLQAVNALKMGDPLKPDTEFGPMVDLANAERIERWVAAALKDGARLACGGKRRGTLFEPTVLERVPKHTDIYCDEAFGPVVTLESFKTFDEALCIANDSRYGINAGVFTRDLYRALQAFDALEYGAVNLNDASVFRADNMPFGGVKDSGCGREGVKYAIEEMTEPKILIINMNAPGA